MGYFFPLIRNIDEGVENWLDPMSFKNIDGMDLVSLKFFTFLPDFTPNSLMKLFGRIEFWLENSPLYHLSVHYMAILQKSIG